MAKPTFLALCIAAALASYVSAAPNIIVLMADDLDLLLGGTAAMAALQTEMVLNGTSLRGYVDVPVCCPSRTSTLSGLYAHRLNDTSQGWCGNFHRSYEGRTWVAALRNAGYRTALFGKYTNDYTAFCDKAVHVPAEWEHFYAMCSDNAYFNNSMNDQGTMTRLAPGEYLTNAIGNASITWLRGALADQRRAREAAQQAATTAASAPSTASSSATAAATAAGAPIFAYIAVHAPHVPATPAVEYENAPLPNGYSAPRTPSWNETAHPDAFWLEATRPPLSDALAEFSDQLYARRMRSTLSLDDIIAAVYSELRSAGPGVASETVVLFTSDHGYNLGQHRAPSGKFRALEHDIRVPFVVTGPGVPRNASVDALVNNVDIAPTVLQLAGVPPSQWPSYRLDGTSFAQLLTDTGTATGPAAGVDADAPASTVAAPSQQSWARDRLLVEYWGLGYVWRGPCANGTTACPGGPEALEDVPSNTWSGLRIRNASADVLYVEYRPGPASPLSDVNHTEAYDLSVDPWQLVNAAPSGSVAGLSIAALSRELAAVANCAGASCP